MCGRYSIAIEKEDLEEAFGVRISEPFMKRYNAAPSQELPVILNNSPETISYVSWGLSPAWMSKMKNFRGLINVRAETLRDRRTFRQDLLERRCLIPADGFYEWKKSASGQKIPVPHYDAEGYTVCPGGYLASGWRRECSTGFRYHHDRCECRGITHSSSDAGHVTSRPEIRLALPCLGVSGIAGYASAYAG